LVEALVGHDRQRAESEALPGRARHRVKLAPVGRLVGDVVMDDQASVGVDGGLHVVAGRLETMAVAHRPRLLFAFDEGRAIIRLQPGREPVQLGAPGAPGGECRGNRARLIVGLGRVRRVQPGEVGGNLQPTSQESHNRRPT
jgi:hypothetical protein